MSPPDSESDDDERPGPKAWSGPWADDVREAFGLLQGAVGAIVADPQVRDLVHRTGPDLLDRVSELASGLAATLRAPASDQPADSADAGPGPGDPSPRPPTTVRIDVTD